MFDSTLSLNTHNFQWKLSINFANDLLEICTRWPSFELKLLYRKSSYGKRIEDHTGTFNLEIRQLRGYPNSGTRWPRFCQFKSRICFVWSSRSEGRSSRYFATLDLSLANVPLTLFLTHHDSWVWTGTASSGHSCQLSPISRPSLLLLTSVTSHNFCTLSHVDKHTFHNFILRFLIQRSWCLWST